MKENNLIRAQRPFEKKTLLISLLKAMFLVLIAITVFEYAKHLIFPRLTVFYSHIIGIIFGVMFIGATGYRVQKRQEQLSMEKIAETEKRMRSEASLLDVAEKYHKLFIDSMDGVCQTTLDGKIVEANQAFCDILGCDTEGIIGESITQFYDNPEDRVKFRNVIEKNNGVKNYEIIQRRKDGQQIICSISSSCYYAENEVLSGYLSIVRDITERKRVEEALKGSEKKYYDLYDNAPDMYYTVDSATGIIQECNETFVRVTGYSKEELIGRSIFELYDEGSADDAKQSFQQFPVTGEVHDAERRVTCKDGRIIHISLNVSAIRDKDGNITHSRSIWRDITKRKEQEELIRALSITDQLTGLYNRRGFMTLAEQQLRVAERTKNGLFLLYADLDGLKQINDKLGHKSGDEAIVEAANVLKEVFRKMDIIARMGGDEFAVLAPEASLEYADMIKHRLQDQLDIHNSKVGRDYKLSLSIGMVYHDPSSSSSLDELISRADSLMYEQKWRKKSLETQKISET